MFEFIIDNIATIATLGFVTGFIWIVFNTYCKKNKAELEEHSQMPFKDDD